MASEAAESTIHVNDSAVNADLIALFAAIDLRRISIAVVADYSDTALDGGEAFDLHGVLHADDVNLTVNDVDAANLRTWFFNEGDSVARVEFWLHAVSANAGTLTSSRRCVMRLEELIRKDDGLDVMEFFPLRTVSSSVSSFERKPIFRNR